MIERARQAAAERLKQAAVASGDGARVAAEATGKVAAVGAGKAAATLRDPATHQKAKDAAAGAGRGIQGALDKLNPGVLAGIIIKATTIQEHANEALREAGSFYRINAIQIGVSFPPSVTFQIERLVNPDLHQVPTAPATPPTPTPTTEG